MNRHGIWSVQLSRLVVLLICSAIVGCGGEGSGTGSEVIVASSGCDDAAVAIPRCFRWLAAWGNTRETGASTGTGPAPVDTTVRNIARVTSGGIAERMRFLNEDATRSIVISNASIGLREGNSGGMLQTASSVLVTFN